ncbi:type II secretion system F family protein [Prosthecomicrobium sp. N25]|uniref:type II secretion system F family protein n=1 Tax=Prosthecomicrobium sp. N25 TaxID=3129254 RepID=UPI0030775C2D
MARFAYTALASDGRSLTGEAEAADEFGVANELGARGLMLVEAKRLASAGGGASLFATRVDPRAVTRFLGDLALMLRSGLTIDEALLLASEDLKGGLRDTVRTLRSDILAGSGVVQSLERHGEVFPPEVVAMAKVAEATGHLDRVLAAVAAQRARSHALADKVGAALRYPAFLLVGAVGVLTFFLVSVVPQFAGLIADSGGNPGALVTAVLGLSAWLAANFDLVGGVLIAVLSAGLLGSRVKSVRDGFIRSATTLPIVRGVWSLRRTALFTTNLGTLLGQGVPLSEALKVLESILGPAGQEAVAAVGDEVRRGGRLSEALGRVDLLPDVAVRMLRMGEETGELATVAAEAGALYEKKLTDRLDRVGALVGPIAIITIAVVIGGLMVTIMSALMSVNQLVQ